METLTVLYDPHCKLCCSLHSWLEAQPAYISLAFVSAGSAEARERFPDLHHEQTTKELTVISDQGEVYFEAKAWIMCLWALRDYRGWSLRLSTPEFLPMAQRVVVWISQNRFRFGTKTLEEILREDAGSIDCREGCIIK